MGCQVWWDGYPIWPGGDDGTGLGVAELVGVIKAHSRHGDGDHGDAHEADKGGDFH